MTATPVRPDARSDARADARTGAAEQAGYRRAYVFVSFGLLLSVAYRSFVLGDTAWDLLALVVLGGVVTAVDRGRSGTLTGRWALLTLLTVAAALAFAAALASVGR